MSETFGSFFRALKRRKILGVAVAYCVVGFGHIEASGVIVPRLQSPQQVVDVLIALVFFAFPVTMLATWLLGSDDESGKAGRVLPPVSLIFVASISGWFGLRVLRAGATANPLELRVKDIMGIRP